MKRRSTLASIISLFLFGGLVAGSLVNTSSESKSVDEGGVFICEDTGEEGPMFYAADYSSDVV